MTQVYSQPEEDAALVREDVSDDAINVVKVSFFASSISRRLLFGLFVLGASFGLLFDKFLQERAPATVVMSDEEEGVQAVGIFQEEISEPEGKLAAMSSAFRSDHLGTVQQEVDSEIPPGGFPTLSELVQGERINGDISWLLDFAIVGNAKCGTSFLMRYLGQSNDTFIPQHEICKMSKGRPDEIVKMFYNQSKMNGRVPGGTADLRKIKNGLKCPKESSTELALANYAKYFPNTKFIVTTRHPVLWFQSFYNYRSHGNGKLPPPHELIGPCMDGSPYVCSKKCAHATHTQNVCTDRAKFHHYLSRFGKTPMSSSEEKKLLKHEMETISIKGEVFLMELGQVLPSNLASRHLARDLQEFLGLEEKLPELEFLPPESAKYTDEEKEYFINICDKQHAQLRKVLVDIGREASIWIRDYFVKSPDVVVSDETLFLELIEKWGHDPCP